MGRPFAEPPREETLLPKECGDCLGGVRCILAFGSREWNMAIPGPILHTARASKVLEGAFCEKDQNRGFRFRSSALFAFGVFAGAGAQASTATPPVQEGAQPAERAKYVITEQDLLSGTIAFFKRRNNTPAGTLRVVMLDASPQKLEWRVVYEVNPDPLLFRCWISPKTIRSATDFARTTCRRVNPAQGVRSYLESIERRSRPAG